MKHTYNTIPICVEFDESEGELVIETASDCVILDRDEAVSLAEKLRDWLLQDE